MLNLNDPKMYFTYFESYFTSEKSKKQLRDSVSLKEVVQNHKFF